MPKVNLSCVICADLGPGSQQPAAETMEGWLLMDERERDWGIMSWQSVMQILGIKPCLLVTNTKQKLRTQIR